MHQNVYLDQYISLRMSFVPLLIQHHLIEYSNIHPIVYTNTKDSGINLTARYLCPTKKRRYSEHEFWEALLTKFGKDPKLELAYPTQRVSVDQT